jgi:hypothetical protein
MDKERSRRQQAIDSIQELIREHTQEEFPVQSSSARTGRGTFVGRNQERKRLQHHLLRPGMHAAAIGGPSASGRTRLAREIAIEAELLGWSVHWLERDSKVPAAWNTGIQPTGTLLVLEDVDLWSQEALSALPLGHLKAPVAIIAIALGGNVAGSWRGSLLRLPEDPAWLEMELEPLSDEDATALFVTRGAAPNQNELIAATIAAVGRNPGALHDAIDALAAHEAEITPDGWHLEARLVRQALDESRVAPDEGTWKAMPIAVRESALALSGWPGPLWPAAIAELTERPVDSVLASIRTLEWAGWAEQTSDGWRIVPQHRADWILEHAEARHARERIVSALRRNIAAMDGGDPAITLIVDGISGPPGARHGRERSGRYDAARGYSTGGIACPSPSSEGSP